MGRPVKPFSIGAGLNNFPMNGESTLLTVGEHAGMSHVVSTPGLPPLVFGRPQEALRKRQDLSPSLLLSNLPRGTVEPRFLHALSKKRTPSRILADPEAPSRKVSLNNRGSTCALARCTMATFTVPFGPS